jgi:hypothetical protein
MSDPELVTVVAGLPRSGTSLLMQMLHVAGLRCAGEWPDFETEETLQPSREFVDSMRGGVLKLLDPQRTALPVGPNYRFLFTTRNKTQQARSVLKMVSAVAGIGYSEGAEAKLRESLVRDESRALGVLRDHRCFEPFMVCFDNVVSFPAISTDRVAGYLGLPPGASALMRACILERTAECHPRMLEVELLARPDPRANANPLTR